MPYELQKLPGVGPQTRKQAQKAAEGIALATRRSRTVHIDVDDRDAETTRLLLALHRLVAVGPELPRARRTAEAVGGRLRELIPQARPIGSWLRRLLSGSRRRARAERAVERIAALLAERDRDQAAHRPGDHGPAAPAAGRGPGVDRLRDPRGRLLQPAGGALRPGAVGPDRRRGLPARRSGRAGQGAGARRHPAAGLAPRLSGVRRPVRARPAPGDPR
ncbi:hypothetical protein ACFSTC_56440 [Nonomuraea ferruginea]